MGRRTKKCKKVKQAGDKVLSKGALAEALATESGMKRQECAKVLECLIKVAAMAVKKHGKFVLPGICMLKSMEQAPREASVKEIDGKEVEMKARPGLTLVKAIAVAAFKKEINGQRTGLKREYADLKKEEQNDSVGDTREQSLFNLPTTAASAMPVTPPRAASNQATPPASAHMTAKHRKTVQAATASDSEAARAALQGERHSNSSHAGLPTVPPGVQHNAHHQSEFGVSHAIESRNLNVPPPPPALPPAVNPEAQWGAAFGAQFGAQLGAQMAATAALGQTGNIGFGHYAGWPMWHFPPEHLSLKGGKGGWTLGSGT